MYTSNRDDRTGRLRTRILNWLPDWVVLVAAMVVGTFMPYTPQPPNDAPPTG